MHGCTHSRRLYRFFKITGHNDIHLSLSALDGSDISVRRRGVRCMHVACKMQNKVQGNRQFNVRSLSYCTEIYFRCRDVRTGTLMERINVNVLFFAKAREIVGRHSSTLTLDLKSNTTTGDQILRLILEQVPGLANISESIVLAVDQEYTSPDQTIVLKEGSEIALIPPLSGG